jgi:predicted DsbA family dithiol-disulfide isomerase
MQVTVYFDYTCNYSYKLLHWLVQVIRQGNPLELTWATFSLKEANRDHDSLSPFDDEEISSLSVLALALSHAARNADFGRYHFQVFEAMHGRGFKLTEGDLLQVAAAAGIDVDEFNRNRPQWLSAVDREHRGAVTRWKVFGTPTLVLADDAAVWVKLSESPDSPGQSVDLWRSLCTLSMCHPDLIEIRRPV